MVYRILIVEDDNVISSALKKHTEAWGYEVACVNDFKSVMDDFNTFSPHLVLLDISLPFYNGYHWCNEIRKISKVPIIFISSSSDDMNIVLSVNMGGDDFISKPFNLEVLTAKIGALLRRTYDFTSTNCTIEADGAQLNTNDMTFSYNGKTVELTKNEYRILQILMENRGKVITRDTLMTRLWETDSYVDDNTLTVNITRLRKVLEDIGLTEYIVTKKGTGYMVR
jgi:DNA-binding response OmpR family regulator